MFVATREIRHAKGRFGLMVAVVAMITLLLVVLTALTQGLGEQSTSAVTALPADRVVLTPTDGSKASYADSVIKAGQLQAWQGRDGVRVEALHVGHARVEKAGSTSAATVAVFGAQPGAALADGLTDAHVALPREAADSLGVGAGDTVVLNGEELTVARVTDTLWYSHSAVATVTAPTFAAMNHLHADQVGSVLLAHVDAGVDKAVLTELDQRAGTVSFTRTDSLQALPGFQSERSSLTLIQGFLYGISALVVLSFVSVWTIQRTRDLAVLRALGGSRGYVLRDALGQAALLLLTGTVLGGVLGTAVVVLLAGRAPVLLQVLTVAAPVLGIAVLGLLGSWIATRRVSRVDPLLALGGN